MAENENQEQNPEEVEITSHDQKFHRSVEHGVMDDDLNYKRLLFWSGFIIVMVVIFLVALIEMYGYTSFVLEDQVQQKSTFTQIENLRDEGKSQLNSFGVVNADKGIYHIPIDSAIKIMAQDSVQ